MLNSVRLGYKLNKLNNTFFFLWYVKGGINSSECENLSRKKEMSEELEASTMDSLVDKPFATIDIKDDCGSKYFIKYICI